MSFLLDVNVLIPLVDQDHSNHEAAHRWFAANRANGWATCPITENAVLRILGHINYPNSPGSPMKVLALLRALRQSSSHEFWADDLSLIDVILPETVIDLASAQVTDLYLLALAASRGSQLATFDKRIASVVHGKLAAALSVIE